MSHPSTANTLMTTVDINASLQRFWETEDSTEHTQRDPSHEKVENLRVVFDGLFRNYARGLLRTMSSPALKLKTNYSATVTSSLS